MVDFKEEIYEIAFGDNAINRGWTDEEVIAQIRWYSDTLHEVSSTFTCCVKDRLNNIEVETND